MADLSYALFVLVVAGMGLVFIVGPVMYVAERRRRRTVREFVEEVCR